MYQSTLTNTVANANRGAWVKSGRQADTEHQARVNKRRKTIYFADDQEDVIGNASDTGNEVSKPQSDVVTELGKHYIYLNYPGYYITNNPRNCSAQYRKLVDTPVNPSPASNETTTTPQAPVPSPPLNTTTTITPQALTPSPALSFSSFTDYERDAEIIALMHGPLPKGDDEEKRGTKRRSKPTTNKNDIAEPASGTNYTSSGTYTKIASFPLATHTKAESSSASSHAHASSNNKGRSCEL